jgi:hypothetical protein
MGLLATILLACAVARAEEWDLSWFSVDGGGATFSAGGEWELGGTIAQPDAARLTAGEWVLNGGFWYEAGPAVVSITPSFGPTVGGTPVTITGSGLTGATSATFGAAPASGLVVVGDTTITCCTPPAVTPGFVDVCVTTPDGSAALEDGFEYISPPEFTTPPSASPSPSVVNRNVLFSCGVTDPGGYAPVTLEWDFGDGQTATGVSVGHVYRRPGIYQVTATATNSRGIGAVAQLAPDLIIRGMFGQLDSDACHDLTLWDPANGNVWAYLMEGKEKREERFVLDEDHLNYAPVSTGDFDRDGKSDLILRGPGNGVYARFLDGTTPGPLYRVGGASAALWQAVSGTDLDGDGCADILFRRVTDGVVYAWMMNPGRPPTVRTIARIGSANPARWTLVTGTGDLTGDRSLDLVWRQIPAPHRIYLWIMGSPVVMGISPVAPMAPEWQCEGGGDFSGDGKYDLLWCFPVTWDMKLWEMDGTSVISEETLVVKVVFRQFRS